MTNFFVLGVVFCSFLSFKPYDSLRCCENKQLGLHLFPTKSPACVVHKGAKKVLLFLPCIQQVNRWLGFTCIHTSSHGLADTLPDSGLSNSSVLSI